MEDISGFFLTLFLILIVARFLGELFAREINMNNYLLQKLENIIRRIFNSMECLENADIKVSYLGEKTFDKEVIDQRCFQFNKSNSDFLFFELLILEHDAKLHTIALEQFMQQIMFKYNVENIACYLHDGKETDKDHQQNLIKKNIFEIVCSNEEESHTVFVNIDPEEFFS